MFGKKIQVQTCDHENKGREYFHTVWGFGRMCAECKTVLNYQKFKQDLGLHNDCEECHYNCMTLGEFHKWKAQQTLTQESQS